ncbi:Transcriptional regulator OS=Streptomyces fumanus OX=67302 GN=GCM10018772_40270 PE=4 SV=1 [Streptomyces fumanus]
MIAGRRGTPVSSARVAGYRSALTAAGPERPEYVRTRGRTGGRRGGCGSCRSAGPPTAVFVCCDPMALGVYEALAERGYGCRTR